MNSLQEAEKAFRYILKHLEDYPPEGSATTSVANFWLGKAKGVQAIASLWLEQHSPKQ